MSESNNLVYVGVTRFSLVASSTLGSFRATKGKSLAEAKKAVWDEDRLRKRLWFFETFCLPSYASNRRSRDTSHGLVILNRDFPLKEDVQRLCRTVPNLKVVEMQDNDDFKTVVHAETLDVTSPGQRIFSYRYDDDDALSSEFLPLVDKYAKVTGDHGCISFNLGYSLLKVPGGQFGFRPRRYPLNAFGIGILSRRDNIKLIFDMGPHTSIKSEVTHDKENFGWLAPVHDGNDSHVGEWKHEVLDEATVIAQMAELFPHVDGREIKNLPIIRKPDVRPA